MTSLFEKELMRMEQEVRDLKTAHNIPLGSLSFYQKSGSLTWDDTLLVHTVYVRVTLKPGESEEPFLEIIRYVNANDEFWLAGSATKGWENNGTMWQEIFYFALIDNKTINVEATCSSNFDWILKKYEDGDWVGDLPEEIA